MDSKSTCRVLVLVLLSLSNCDSLNITRLSIPSFVRNGSEESVLLDCEYIYDIKEDKNLVVKWYHENDPEPVYQWIAELDVIQVSGKFRVNSDYMIPTGDLYTRSRALNILRPTTEMSGRYTCQVLSHAGQDADTDIMVIYALPTYVNLNYTTVDGKVFVFCEVEGIYPLPEMSMFQIRPGEVDRTPVDDIDLDYELKDGSYDLVLSTNISERDLATDGLRFFGCAIALNGTEYAKILEVPYFPVAKAEKQAGVDSSSGCLRYGDSIILSLLSLLLLFT